MMFLLSKIQLLIPAFIALFVIFDSQSVLCLDLDGQQQATDSRTSLYSQVRDLESKQTKKSKIEKDNKESKKSKIEKDSRKIAKKRSVDAAKPEEKRKETTTSLSVSSASSSSVDEDDSSERDEEDTNVIGRQSVMRPSSILGREPTTAPISASEENNGVLRPGSSYFADETPYPTQSSRNQQNNPVTQNGISRPGGSSTTSFAYPTVSPTYSPIDRQINPVPINYIPRPGTTSSWLEDGSQQSYEANRSTSIPTPNPTTFPPVAVPGLNIPVGRPGSLLLPERPSNSPSDFPSTVPSKNPTLTPTRQPTRSPTLPPTRAPTNVPTTRPTRRPTRPTYSPTFPPTSFPTISPEPSVAPSDRPTISPSSSPSGKPSETPSDPPSGMPSSFSGTLTRPSQSGSVSSFFTKSPTFFPTIVDIVDDDITINTTDDAFDDDAEEITQSISSPSVAPMISMQQSVTLYPTTASVPLRRPVSQDDPQGARPAYSTWAPTTFLPTDTFAPTVFIDWTAGAGGRNEPHLSPSAIDESASVDSRSQDTDVLPETR